MKYGYPHSITSIFVAIACLWQLSSCCNGHVCSADESAVHILQLRNFSQHELDSVVVKNCQTINNQTRVVDSFTTKADANIGNVLLPESYIALQSAPDSGSYFMSVYFPNDSLSYRLDNITVDTVFCMKCAGRRLYNAEIKTVSLNGVPQQQHELVINR